MHYSIRNCARNAVFATKGASKETTCTTDSMRIIIGNNVETNNAESPTYDSGDLQAVSELISFIVTIPVVWITFKNIDSH